MPMRAPRIERNWAEVIVNRFEPSNSASPLTRTLAPRVSPTIVCTETLLPEPDSPTMPRVRPLSTLNDRSRTARTRPSGVSNDTESPFTSSMVTSPILSFGSGFARTSPCQAKHSARHGLVLLRWGQAF